MNANIEQANLIYGYWATLLAAGINCDLETAAKAWIAKNAAQYRAALNAKAIAEAKAAAKVYAAAGPIAA
jgi:hypothetical protein